MKLVPMEVNYYMENPGMDIESEPANYAYRWWSHSDHVFMVDGDGVESESNLENVLKLLNDFKRA